MKKHYSRSFIASTFVIVCYVTFATIAFARFPLPYSPTRNWLSDLGNPLSNPDIATFRYHPWYPRWLLGFGAVVVLVNVSTQIIFHDVCVSEWIDVPLLLSYCLLLGIKTDRITI